jgi:hypothetical protein
MASLKLSVVFQSRASDGLECSAERVLLHSADIKALKTSIGSYVLVELPHCSCLCRVWPSKKIPVGSATLHRTWQPNFSGTGTQGTQGTQGSQGTGTKKAREVREVRVSAQEAKR